jgi:signal transduction histidine kinase
MDAVNYYILFAKITQRKNPFAKENIVFILLWGLIMGSVPSLLPSEKYILIQKFILTVGLFLSIYIFYNHRKNLHDTVILFGMLSGWTLFLNIIVFKILEIINFSNQITMLFVGQFLVLTFVLFSLFLPIDKVYKISRTSIIAELMLCFLTIVYWGFFLKARFDAWKFLNDADIMIYIMTILSFVFFGKSIEQYEKERKMHSNYAKMMQAHLDDVLKRIHKTDNIISSINGALAINSSLDEVRKNIKIYASMIEIDENMKKIITADNKYIVAFLHAKKQQARENGVDIISDIDYKSECQLIPEHIIIIDLLGELLDNAIQNSKKDTIIRVRMQIDKLSMHLEVQNRHEWIDLKTKKQIFRKGYSANKNTSSKRGYGLSNVEEAVKNHHGLLQVINAHDEDNKRVVIFKISIFRN